MLGKFRVGYDIYPRAMCVELERFVLTEEYISELRERIQLSTGKSRVYIDDEGYLICTNSEQSSRGFCHGDLNIKWEYEKSFEATIVAQ
jgi:hypothetical protein